MPPPQKLPDYYTLLNIAIRDIQGKILENETFWVTGRKRLKTVKGTTDKTGRVIMYVPKGDTYDVHFKYNRGYYSTDCPYTKGTTDIRLNFNYLGTKEIEKRKKEEAERLAEEEKRLKEERERFEKHCKELGLDIEECYRKEREEHIISRIGLSDTVINVVFRRNKWVDKLIVCDVTGSMDPYAAQLLLWFRTNRLTEKTSQFVFFNDGDEKADDAKKIGDTGGIYYLKSGSADSLDYFMSRVQAAGSGGDAPENNMEALIKGIKMAAPFKEIIMIADNYAPVKDIKLLGSFNRPVHIILCGVTNDRIEPDYLLLAWKTKGTIHTMEEDIAYLARLSEGQQVRIADKIYRIMGGEFILVN